jgi:hypothetical protein
MKVVYVPFLCVISLTFMNPVSVSRQIISTMLQFVFAREVERMQLALL